MFGNFFQKVGNFFTGSGWVDDEEERRRKQQQAQQKQQQPKPQQRQVQSVNDLFGLNRKKTSADPLRIGDALNAQTSLQVAKPTQQPTLKVDTPKPQPQVQVPKKAPLPDMEFKGVSEGEGKNKTIFGKNAAWLLPKQFEKKYEVKADRNVTTNKDKYVAQFDKMHPDYQKILVNSAREQAANGDQAAINTLKALEETGRLKGGFTDFVEGSNERLFGGLGRGLARGADFLLPGKNTWGLEQWANETDPSRNKTRQFTGAGQAGEKFGTAQKGIVDIATIVIPTSKMDAAMKGSKLIRNMQDGSKLVQVGGRIVRVVPGSMAGTGIDYLQEHGRGNDPNLAKSAATGLGVDLAVEAAPGLLGRLVRTGRRAFGRGGSDIAEEGAGIGLAGGSKLLREQLDDVARQADELDPVARQEAELLAEQAGTPRDLTAPKGTAKEAAQDIGKVLEELPAGSAKVPKAVQELTERTRQEINAIRANSTLTEPQKLAQTQEVMQTYQKTAKALDESLGRTSAQVDEAIGKQQAKQADLQQTVKEVQDAQDNTIRPSEGSGGATSAEVRANDPTSALDAYVDEGGLEANELLDTLLQSRGINLASDEITPRLQNRVIQRMVNAMTGGRSDVSTLGEMWKSGVVDPISERASNAMRNAMYSSNPITSKIAQLPRTVFANTGFNQAQRQALRGVEGGRSAASTTARQIARDVQGKMRAIGNQDVLNERLTRFFETPDFLARRFGDDAKIKFEQLAPEEQEIVADLINLNKVRNRVNYETGLISKEQFDEFADGMHSPRVYDIKADAKAGGTLNNFDETAGIQRKELSEISDDTFNKVLDNPAQGMMVRMEAALRNKAQLDAIKRLDEAGLVFDSAPNKGFTQLKGRQYGEFDGKWVDNQVATQLKGKSQFNTEAGKKVDDLLDSYRNSFMGKLDRGQKQIKTVFSPGTFIGNVFSNPMFFNRGAGTNAITQSVKMVKASEELIQHRAFGKFNPAIYELEKAGLFGNSTGRTLVGENAPEFTVLKDGAWKKNPVEAAKAIYGGVDDAAKLALYKNLRKKGLTNEKALTRVAQFTQDYSNAGRLIQMLADSPVMGKPFARFVPELIRITKNNAIYNPLGMVSGLAALAMVQNEMSRAAGETPEERAAREGAVGQTRLPGTAWLNELVGGSGDISLNFPVGDSAINVARSVGLNFPQEPGGDPSSALIKQLAPFVIPTRQNAQGDTVFSPAEIISSLAMSPIADQIANRDFMGRSITDPTNRVYYENGQMKVQKFSGEQRPGEAEGNRLKTLAMNYLPLANETNALFSAATGQEDYYGKQRTIPEAVMRAIGLKTESNDAEARQKRVETQRYFEEDVAATQQFLRENPDLAGAYYTLNNPTRNRYSNVRDKDIITPEKWDIVNSDTSGRLFNFMKDQAIKNYQKDGKPVDPIYLLDPDRARYVAELRSRPSGDDIEAEEILRATQPWYKQFEDVERQFYEAQANYFEQNPIVPGAEENPRVLAYREASKPVEQPPVIQRYFQIMNEQGKDAAREFSRAQGSSLQAAFDQYSVLRLNRINAMRAIEGYPPIDREVWDNKTFGFDAKGGGGYGRSGGGSYQNDYAKMGRLTNTSVVKRLGEIDPQDMPAVQQMLKRLMAGRGGRRRVTLGAASRGNG